MRLINATTLELDFFYGDDIPRYAILSHTWGKEEVTFQDWQSLESAKTKAGFTKIEGACRQAIRDGLEYVWVDTNCIDKSSSSELSEAINSMFAWYRNSQRCYVHLADVTESPLGPSHLQDPVSHASPELRRRLFQESRWFGRGWTLQELLAPGRCFFYGADWDFLGTKEALAPFISEATSIESKFILGTARIDSASISKRMSWVSKRKTTRTEDIAYCMLGIFNINMPMLYGEGTRAFLRLQEELIKISADQTIFCWEWGSGMPPSWCSILAPSPAEFANCSGFSPKLSSFAGEITPYVLTNVGMTMTFPYLQTTTRAICGILNVGHKNSDLARPTFITFHQTSDGNLFQRSDFPRMPFQMGDGMKLEVLPPKVFNIRARQSDGLSAPTVLKTSFRSPHGFLLLFDTVTDRGYIRYANAHAAKYTSGMPILRFAASPGQDFYGAILNEFKDMNGQPVDSTIILALRTHEGSDAVSWYCQIVPPGLISPASSTNALHLIMNQMQQRSLQLDRGVWRAESQGIRVELLEEMVPAPFNMPQGGSGNGRIKVARISLRSPEEQLDADLRAPFKPLRQEEELAILFDTSRPEESWGGRPSRIRDSRPPPSLPRAYRDVRPRHAPF